MAYPPPGAVSPDSHGGPDQADARREVDYRPGAAAGSAGMVGNVASQLQQHARRGFEDSERLFREAARRVGDGNSPTGRYLTAAWDYAHTLESMVGWSGGASGTGSSGAGAGQAGAGAASGAMASGRGMTGTSDMQWACLANHGVKEVLDGSKIKTMCRLMGNRGEATETLRQHAQQMHTEGMRLVQSLAATAGPTARREPAGTGTGESLLDAATARSRDRDVRPASGARGGTAATTTGAADTGGAGGAGGTGTGTQAAGAGSRTGAGGTTGIGAGGTGTGTAGLGAPGTRGDATITLAQQAQELIRVIDELDNNTVILDWRGADRRVTIDSNLGNETKPATSSYRWPARLSCGCHARGTASMECLDARAGRGPTADADAAALHAHSSREHGTRPDLGPLRRREGLRPRATRDSP